MANPYEQDVILDADGQPIFAALDKVRSQIDQIQRAVAEVAKTANKGVADYGNILTNQVKEMQQSLGQIRTLAQAKNAPGFNIQDQLANQKLAKATTQATEYARSIYSASTAVDGLRGKLNMLNVEIAKRGALGKNETLQQTQLRRGYEQQITLLTRLDAELAKLDRRATRTQLAGYDMKGETAARNALLAARTNVETAALSPNRYAMNRELGAYQKQLAAYDVFLSGVRTRHAEQLAEERRSNAALKREQDRAAAQQQRTQADLAKQRTFAGFDDSKAAAVDRAREIRDLGQLNTERGLAITRLRELRVARQQANSPEQIRNLTNEIGVERTYIATLEQEIRVQERLRAQATQRLKTGAAGTAGAAAFGGQRSAVSNILSPGYAAAAFARTAVYGGAAMAAYGAYNVVKGGIDFTIQFQDELGKLAAIANATGGQMQQLKASILGVAEGSRFSTVELTQIAQKLAQAGVSAGQMRSSLQAVSTLSAASGSSPDEAVDLVTAAVGAFNLQASETPRVADLMTTALNRTRLTVSQAAAAIQYVGATAKEQNISLEALLATAATMSQAGIKSGSTIGTGLRQFLIGLQEPTKDLKDQLDRLHISSDEIDVTVRGLPAVLESLSKAGFGAAQAYAGLETRAAAAYLVLQNNIPLIDQLQGAMLDSGVAAEANAKAMSTFSAQWQRFKNVVGEEASQVFQPAIDGLKDLFKALADLHDEQAKLDADTDTTPGQRFLNSILTTKDKMGHKTYGLGDAVQAWLEGTPFNRLAESLGAVTTAAQKLDTKIANTNDTIQNQQGKIGELRDEYQRLLVQKDSLINNDQRASNEMVSLMQRFEGLSGYLTNTKNQYVDLTNAMQGFITASEQALSSEIAVQQANLAQQQRGLLSDRSRLGSQIKSNPAYGSLPKDTREAFESLYRYGPGTDQYLRSTSKIADYSRLNPNAALAPLLSQLAMALQSGQANISTQRVLGTERNAADAATTKQGQDITRALTGIETLLTQAEHSDKKGPLLGQANSQILAAQKLFNFTPQTQFKSYFDSQKAELESYAQQAKALAKPSRSEQIEADRAEREAARKEREADREAQRPIIQRSDIIDLVKAMYGAQVSVGSGYRTPAYQDSLHRRGLTTATGATSPHSNPNMIGQDFPIKGGISEADGQRMAAAIKARLAAEGITATVIYESGAGRNNGTGPHIHIGVKRGMRYATGKGPGVDDQNVQSYDSKIDKARQSLDQKALADAIQEATNSTSDATFNAAVTAANASREKVENDIRNIAASELASQGLGPEDPEYKARMQEVEQEIAQLRDDTSEKLAAGILKNVRATFTQVDKMLEDQLHSSTAAVNLSQARVSGFGYASNDGRIPDYVKQLAERQAAQASENADRARFAALPGAISSKEEALSSAQQRLATLQQSTAEYEKQKLEVDDLTREITKMKDEETSLGESLHAGNLVPTTLKQGLDQAIAAYREYHQLDRSFKDDVIFNLGGILEQTHQSITTFFTDIFTGSKTVLQAFGDMVKGIVDYLAQLAAQFVANKIFSMLLNLVGVGLGGATGSTTASGGNAIGLGASSGFANAYRGGKIGYGPLKGYAIGGKVVDGYRSHDSVNALLSKDEWVINRPAAESLGDDFMHDINKRGSKAVMDRMSTANIIQSPKQTTNVYVVAPDQKPSLSRNDVLVTMHDDMLNGESRKLVKSISQGG